MKIATLAIIMRGNQVLLGRKQGKPEIGEGTLNGPGGKREPGESNLQCLIREVEEEVGITINLLDISEIKKRAVITFYAAGNPDFEVHVYRVDHFTGIPHETESMVPAWYNIENIPFDRMLESDRTWFRRVIEGEKFRAKVYYRERAKSFERIEFFPFSY